MKFFLLGTTIDCYLTVLLLGKPSTGKVLTNENCLFSVNIDNINVASLYKQSQYSEILVLYLMCYTKETKLISTILGSSKRKQISEEAHNLSTSSVTKLVKMKRGYAYNTLAFVKAVKYTSVFSHPSTEVPPTPCQPLAPYDLAFLRKERQKSTVLAIVKALCCHFLLSLAGKF